MPALKSAFNMHITFHNKLLAFATSLLLFLPAAQSATFDQWQLKDLHTGKRTDIVQQRQTPTLAMVFQPNCPWCKKQGSILAHIQQHCGDSLNLLMLGDKGRYMVLKRELRHLPATIPAYQTNPAFLRAIGGVKASPTLLFIDSAGELLAKKRGFTKQATLAQAVARITHGQCQI